MMLQRGGGAVPTARTRANRKYNEKAYDRLTVSVPKGDREKIRTAAQEAGMSLNGFIVEAITEKMEKARQ